MIVCPLPAAAIGTVTHGDVTFGYTNDFRGSDDPAFYFAGGAQTEVDEGVFVDGGLGYHQSDAFDGAGSDDNYFHYWIGANTTAGPWAFDLTLHGTDSGTDTFDDAADTRIVAGVGISF